MNSVLFHRRTRDSEYVYFLQVNMTYEDREVSTSSETCAACFSAVTPGLRQTPGRVLP